MAAIAPPAVSPRRRLITNAAALAVGGVLAQCAFLFVEGTIARTLGVSAYGTFSAMHTLALLMALVLDFGMNWKQVEEGSRDPGTIPVNLGTMLGLKLLGFACAYPLILSGLWLAEVSAPVQVLFALFAPFALLLLLQESLAAVYTATRRNWVNAVFQTAAPFAILAAVWVLVLPRPSLNAAALAYVLGAAAPTSLWLWLTIRSHAPRFDGTYIRGILRGSYLYGVIAVLSHSSFKSGVLLLMLLSNTRELAYFAAAFKFVELGYKVSVLANRLIAPQLFADSRHRPAVFAPLSAAVLRGAGAASALAAVVMIIAGADLLHWVFGDGFTAATSLVQILGASLALKSFALIAQSVVTSADQLAFRTRVVAMSAGFGALVSAPLILAWGARGAAIGVLAGDVALVAALLWRLHSLLPQARVTLVAGVPLIIATSAVWLTQWLDLRSIYALPAAVAAVIILLWSTGYLRPALEAAGLQRKGR